jgi:hypothetical protein
MNLLDDSLFAQDVVDTEASAGLAEEDMDFLNSLEEMVKEVADEPNSID